MNKEEREIVKWLSNLNFFGQSRMIYLNVVVKEQADGCWKTPHFKVGSLGTPLSCGVGDIVLLSLHS